MTKGSHPKVFYVIYKSGHSIRNHYTQALDGLQKIDYTSFWWVYTVVRIDRHCRVDIKIKQCLDTRCAVSHNVKNIHYLPQQCTL